MRRRRPPAGRGSLQARGSEPKGPAGESERPKCSKAPYLAHAFGAGLRPPGDQLLPMQPLAPGVHACMQLTTPPSSKPLYIHSKSCGVANIFSPLIQHHGGPHHGPRARARPRGCWLVGGAERRGHRCTLASCGRPVSGAPNSY